MSVGAGVTGGLKSLTCLSLIQRAEFSHKLIDQLSSLQEKGFALIRASPSPDLLDMSENLNNEILRFKAPHPFECWRH